MALIQFNIPMVTLNVERRLADAFVVLGAQGVSWASDRLRANGSVKTGNLLHSLTYSTDRVQGPTQGQTTGSSIELSDTRLSVHVGSNVVYAARVEFGFTGKDSLGRYYNQPAKSYLRAALLANKEKILQVLRTAVNG